jgi:hypothetical protein
VRRSKAPIWRTRVIGYFLIGLIALDGAVAANRKTWRAYDPDEYRERLRGCRRRPFDMVVVGGSSVSEGIDPTVLAGLSWQGRSLEGIYNLGLPGGTTTEVWHAVRHGVTTPPLVLVYGITASDLNDDREEPHGPHSLMDVGDVADWIQSGHRASEWCVRHFVQGRLARAWQLFQYRNGIRLWAADLVEHVCTGLCPEAAAEAQDGLRLSRTIRQNHGFAPRPDFLSRRLDHLKAAGFKDDFKLLNSYCLGSHLAYLHRLLDWADDHGVKVVLVDMPVSADLDERMYPQAFAAYRAALVDLERTRNVCIVRGAAQGAGLGDADFADWIHLNARGSARFSSWLRRQLSVLPGSPTLTAKNG